MELKLTGNALNRSKNHIGERTTDKGVQVGFFFFFLLKTHWHFKIEVGIVFSRTNPYNFAVTQWWP